MEAGFLMRSVQVCPSVFYFVLLHFFNYFSLVNVQTRNPTANRCSKDTTLRGGARAAAGRA